jgi:hypothetical protein
MKDPAVNVHPGQAGHLVEFTHDGTTEWIAFRQPALAEACREAIQRRIDDPQPVTVAAFADMFIELHVLVKVSGAAPTYLRYLRDISLHFDDRLLDTITKEDILHYMGDMRARGMSDGVIGSRRAVMSSMFNTAKKWRYIKLNPCSGVGAILPASDFAAR